MKSTTKTITGLFCSILVLTGSAAAATVTINGAQTYQTIDGFGVNANSGSWTNADLQPVLDALIDQAGMTLFQAEFVGNDNWEATNPNPGTTLTNWTYYNSVYSASKFQQLWGMMAYLNQRGITNGLMPKFTGPAALWMGGVSLTPGYENEYAQMIASALVYARQTQHLQFTVVPPLNEPDLSGTFGTGVQLSGASQYVAVLKDLGQQLDANGMSDVRFSGPELANTTTSWMATMMSDSYLMSKLAHFGLHSYLGNSADASGISSFIQHSAYPNTHFWMTEFNVWCQSCLSGTGGNGSWANAQGIASYLLNLLAEGASAGLVFDAYDSVYNAYNTSTGQDVPGTWGFWGLFAVDNVNAVPKTYTVRKQFYTLAQIAKYVRPGAQRINLSGSTSILTVLAFYQAATGQLTLTGVNTAGSATALSGTLSSLPTVSSLELYYTDSTSNLRDNGAVPVNNGNFTATVPANCVFTLVGTTAAAAAPVITQQPQSQAVATAGTALFTVAASGAALLGYQWQFNGVPITGGTSTSLTLLNVQAANAGNYTVLVTNSVGSATSAVAVLTVTVPPAITAQPASQSVVAGANTSFSVAASGTPPLSYRWQFNGVAIAGATSTSLTLLNVQPANGGNYAVVVANLAASVTSAVAVLTVMGPPVVTAQPASQSVVAGANTSFSVTASGTPPLSYQWLFSGTKLANGGQFSGATSATLSLSGAQPGNAGGYSVVVTNVAGGVTSTVAMLTVNVPGSCLAPPPGLVGWWPGDGSANDITGTNNGTLQGGATATAVGMVAQAFSFDGTNSFVQIPDAPALKPTNLTVEAWVNFSGLNSALSGTAPAGDQYIVFKQNSLTYYFEGYSLEKFRIANGDAFMFTVGSASGQEVMLLSKTLISTSVWYHVAAVRGSNFMQLYVNGQLESQTNVSFAQNYGTLPLYFGTSHETYWDGKLKGRLDEVSLYNRALSSNEVAAIYSAGAAGKCKVVSGLSITAQPQSQAVAMAGTSLFRVTALGAEPLSYQWQFNGVAVGGATSTSLTLLNVQPVNAGNYTVVVTNSAASVTSAVATLTILAGRPVSPDIITDPISLIINAGATAVFTVTAGGTAPLSYQWLQNLAPLADGGNSSGAASPTMTLITVTETNAGAYTVIITNLAGSATCAVATLTVVVPPQFTSVTLLPDQTPLLSFDAVSNLTYRIDASTDLVNWAALTNIPNPNGRVQFNDPGATNFSQRFYRAVWIP